MGADMMLVGCPLPVAPMSEVVDNILVLQVVETRIAALGDKLLSEVADWCSWDDIDMEADGWQVDVRRRLVGCLEVFDNARRDTTELYLSDRWWIFAGGMTWGDPPSDAYDLLNALALTSVTDEPISAAELAMLGERATDAEG
jgi:hypothetical protein